MAKATRGGGAGNKVRFWDSSTCPEEAGRETGRERVRLTVMLSSYLYALHRHTRQHQRIRSTSRCSVTTVNFNCAIVHPIKLETST